MRHLLAIPGSAGTMKIFYTLTGGIGLVALLVGFSECVFDMDQVDVCADYAVWATDKLNDVGVYLVNWMSEMYRAISERV